MTIFEVQQMPFPFYSHVILHLTASFLFLQAGISVPQLLGLIGEDTDTPVRDLCIDYTDQHAA